LTNVKSERTKAKGARGRALRMGDFPAMSAIHAWVVR
jgi:hypothetical protein